MSVERKRLPKTIWRVVATGGSRRYWEPASKTYAERGWAVHAAENYRRQGATEVHIYRADLVWVEEKEDKQQ